VCDLRSPWTQRLHASADIWLGWLDGSKYVPPAQQHEHEPAEEQAPPRRDLDDARPRAAAIHDAEGTVVCHAETPEKAVEALRELLTLAGPAGRLAVTKANRKLFDRLANRKDDSGRWAREQLEMVRLAELAA
jgi:hypothetical protein